MKCRAVMKYLMEKKLAFFRNGFGYSYKIDWKQHGNPRSLSRDVRCMLHQLLYKRQRDIRILLYSASVQRTWLRHCATIPKVTASLPDEAIEFFDLCNHSSRTMFLESIQPLTEMSTKNLARGVERPARKDDNLTAICEPTVWKNARSLISHNIVGLYGLLQGYMYLSVCNCVSSELTVECEICSGSSRRLLKTLASEVGIPGRSQAPISRCRVV
jgi:hypothetical protein